MQWVIITSEEKLFNLSSDHGWTYGASYLDRKRPYNDQQHCIVYSYFFAIMVVKRPRKSPRVDLAFIHYITIIFEYLHDVRCGVNVSDKKVLKSL